MKKLSDNITFYLQFSINNLRFHYFCTWTLPSSSYISLSYSLTIILLKLKLIGLCHHDVRLLIFYRKGKITMYLLINSMSRVVCNLIPISVRMILVKSPFKWSYVFGYFRSISQLKSNKSNPFRTHSDKGLASDCMSTTITTRPRTLHIPLSCIKSIWLLRLSTKRV